MKILYFDCFSGISGDMILGAFVDAGLDKDELTRAIQKLNLKGVKLNFKNEKRSYISGTRVKVFTPPKKKTAHLSEIKKIIEKSDFSREVKKNAISIFKLLAQVEGQVHRMSPNKVHFHELGALDTIVDIVGACWALERLGIKEIYASHVALGTGTIKTEHGRMPVPVPAVSKLLMNIPTYQNGAITELVTPTGAAILKYFTKSFGLMPAMTLNQVGYGVGSKDFPDRANLLRVFIGHTKPDNNMDQVHILETQLDDLSGELVGHLMDLLMDQGALDVCWTSIHMKKNRPGIELRVIAKPKDSDRLAKVLLRESPTLGIRVRESRRYILPRKNVILKTSYGNCSVKLAYLEGAVIKVKPEFSEVEKIAQRKKQPVLQIYQEIQAIAEKKYLKNSVERIVIGMEFIF